MAGNGAATRDGIDRRSGPDAERLPVGMALPLIGLVSLALWGLISFAVNGML